MGCARCLWCMRSALDITMVGLDFRMIEKGTLGIRSKRANELCSMWSFLIDRGTVPRLERHRMQMPSSPRVLVSSQAEIDDMLERFDVLKETAGGEELYGTALSSTKQP